MARTLQQIYDSIIVAKQARAELNGLTEPPTNVAIWNNWIWVMATCIWIHECLFDQHVADVNLMIAKCVPNSIPWIHEQCVKFQYGDDLVFLDDKFQYAVVDETHRIIKHCAVVEYGQYVFVKVATTAGVLIPDELDAFTEYIKNIKAPGQRIVIYNYGPDDIKIKIDVYYDPLLMLASGELISDGSTPVNDAVKNYINGILFGAEFNRNKLFMALMEIAAVPDAMITSVNAKAHSASVYTSVTHTYTAISGYYRIEELLISYLPYV